VGDPAAFAEVEVVVVVCVDGLFLAGSATAGPEPTRLMARPVAATDASSRLNNEGPAAAGCRGILNVDPPTLS